MVLKSKGIDRFKQMLDKNENQSIITLLRNEVRDLVFPFWAVCIMCLTLIVFFWMAKS
jgi:hypothetical protein